MCLFNLPCCGSARQEDHGGFSLSSWIPVQRTKLSWEKEGREAQKALGVLLWRLHVCGHAPTYTWSHTGTQHCICLCVTLHMVFYIWFHPLTTFCVFLSQITSVYLHGVHLCTDVNSDTRHMSSVFRFQGLTFPEENASRWTEVRSRDDTVGLLRNWQTPPVYSTWGRSVLGSTSICCPSSLLSLPSGYKVGSHRKTDDC